MIEEHLVFDENHYPELKGASEKEQLIFAIRHSVLHVAKRAGKIAEVSEDIDHAESVDIEAIKKIVPKLVVDALHLAGVAGMTWSDIASSIKKRYRNGEGDK